MLSKLIAFSLKNRMMILAIGVIVMLYGGYLVTQQKVDVLPDLNRPTVTIMTEAEGLAPEEVEVLVTFPIESMMNGATNVRRVRSASGIGLSIVWVEFDWGTDIYIDRQIVAERLQLARENLPEGTNPVMAPISSIMGEIMLVGMSSTDGTTSPMDIRTDAEWIVRPQLLSIQGVSQVTVMGGELKQYQVITNPKRLKQYDVTINQLVEALEAANVNAGGGFVLSPTREYLIRIVGRVESLEELANAVVRPTNPSPILVKHLADVKFGSPVKRGDGSVNGKPAVILAIQKQPDGDTLKLTARIDETLRAIKEQLPPDVEIHHKIFRQQEFIDAAVANVIEALRDGGILVVIILFLFLWNIRTSVINITAIPLSIITTFFVFRWLDMSINTMTLGGIAVAIGELVDDSIVDVENIFRRLKENRAKRNPAPFLAVIYKASCEVRNSIVYATLIVMIVMMPLLSLSGIEGRLFAPIGIAYMLSLGASLLVSLTVTPVLASYLLPKAKIVKRTKDAFLLRRLKAINKKVLDVTLRHPYKVIGAPLLLVAVCGWIFMQMGGEFLPPFNEGTFTVNVIAAPGTSLEESNRLGRIAESMIAEVREVETTARRTGRAELDEHAENVNYSEIDVRLKESDRSHEEIMGEIRDKLAYMPGVRVNVGQPISHRIDHLMSGVRAQIAVKIFGPDLETLRAKATEMYDGMSPKKIPGIVDLQLEAQVDLPQIKIQLRPEEIQRYGLNKKEVAEALEAAFGGKTVSQVLEGQRIFDLVVWFDDESRNDPAVIEQTLIETPLGEHVPLSTFAEVAQTTGPNTINRENVVRRIVISCNVQGRDLAAVIGDIQKLERGLQLPDGYYVKYGGQFEAQQVATRQIASLSVLAVLVVFVLLIKALGNWRAALLCMANLPLCFVGGVMSIVLATWIMKGMEWGAVWSDFSLVPLFNTSVLSVASLVGFITLTGIVMRNGIMLISHYIHLMKYEGETFNEQMIVRGALERLAPVMMTALSTGIAVIPLVFGAGQTGKEILHPLAIVIVGGLITTTLTNQFVIPALFYKFGRKAFEKQAGDEQKEEEVPPDLMALARRTT